jgi:hypothetical protein
MGSRVQKDLAGLYRRTRVVMKVHKDQASLYRGGSVQKDQTGM